MLTPKPAFSLGWHVQKRLCPKEKQTIHDRLFQIFLFYKGKAT